MEKHKLDGIDLDWEFPCSGPRTSDLIEYCVLSNTVVDDGGRCPEDYENFPKLMHELRTTLGKDKLLTIASFTVFDKVLE